MLLLDEVAGGLVEHETAALVALVKDVRASGVSIIWIEHIVHALIAAVDRLVVLHGGALIAEGVARRGDPPAAGRGDLYGDRRWWPMPDNEPWSFRGAREASEPGIRKRTLRLCPDSGSGPSGRPGRARGGGRCLISLEVRALDAHYGDFQALFGVSMAVAAGEVAAVIGANGAGKSTLLRCIAGAMRSRGDAIVFGGEPVGDRPAHAMVARGMALVPEGRRLFPSLTVEENLLIGGQLGRPGPWNFKRVYELFPILAERAQQPAPSLSGGQQQMVAIGRALMSNPRLLLCDEISLGLAPIVIRDIYARIPAIVAEGTSLVIVEQDIVQALKVARHVTCLQEGRVALQGEAETLTREKISAAYFGV